MWPTGKPSDPKSETSLTLTLARLIFDTTYESATRALREHLLHKGRSFDGTSARCDRACNEAPECGEEDELE